MPVIDAPVPPAQMPAPSALVVDIESADRTELAAWKQARGVRWWLEMGDRLVVVGNSGELGTFDADGAVRGRIDAFHIERMRLHARGCQRDTTTPGRMIAQGGRWELREFDSAESARAAAAAGEHEGEWQSVQPNSVIAHRVRPQPDGAAADPLIVPLVDAINPARWFADLDSLTQWDRSSYGPELALSRAWIEGRFSTIGLEVSAPAFSMPGSGGGQINVNNVIGRWNGTRLPDEWIIVGAHYDSRNSSLSSTTNTPGAEDNASGCAGVIELARVLVANRPQRSILFMCYAGEEQGLYGSKAHVQALQASGDLARVQAVVTMDMIGYSADTTLDVLFESGATWSAYLNQFADAAAAYVPELRVTLSTNPFGSDHVPYLNAGKKTLLAIENDWDVYPYYHRSTDTSDHVGANAQAMGGAILRTSVAVLAELAGASDRIFGDGVDPLAP
ncbi:M28 family metallopeptidase [Dokdonella immobilis]|uniref:Peptidase family M28 n=1 Tax=Dokdonella immobilis TaxID=578942 RepID=A0A1I4VA39_9GAMM|nr:M28 family metallopeptidase [Dokdonella immobilis]SFM98034.1 Peptidase family M28 [Dokdonella immobilis]